MTFVRLHAQCRRRRRDGDLRMRITRYGSGPRRRGAEPLLSARCEGQPYVSVSRGAAATRRSGRVHCRPPAQVVRLLPPPPVCLFDSATVDPPPPAADGLPLPAATTSRGCGGSPACLQRWGLGSTNRGPRHIGDSHRRPRRTFTVDGHQTGAAYQTSP